MSIFMRHETVAQCLTRANSRHCMQIDVKDFRAKLPAYKISWNIWIDFHGIRVSTLMHDGLVIACHHFRVIDPA